jgi:hypothetical protein
MPECPETDRRREFPRYSLWTLMVLITAVAGLLAFVRLLGFTLLDILIRLAFVTYVIAFLAAPFLAFTVICLSRRLSFRHLPIVGTAFAAALLALPCTIAVCHLISLPSPSAAVSFVLWLLANLFLVGLWWTGQAVFILLVYRHYQRQRQNTPLRQVTYPSKLRIPGGSDDSPPPA